MMTGNGRADVEIKQQAVPAMIRDRIAELERRLRDFLAEEKRDGDLIKAAQATIKEAGGRCVGRDLEMTNLETELATICWVVDAFQAGEGLSHSGTGNGQALAPDTKEEVEERAEISDPDLVLKTLRASHRPMSRRDIYQEARWSFASINSVSVALNKLMKLQYVTKLGDGLWAAR